MIELAHHIQDISENSIRASATLIRILIVEDPEKDTLIIEIEDNGEGMDAVTVKQALSPFFTTKEVRKIGIGLSMFKQAIEATGGQFSINSKPGEGTVVKGIFGYSHIDRQPMGNLGSTIVSLIIANPNIDIILRHIIGGDEFEFDTRLIREMLEDVPLNEPEVLSFIRQAIEERASLDGE